MTSECAGEGLEKEGMGWKIFKMRSQTWAQTSSNFCIDSATEQLQQGLQSAGAVRKVLAQ